MPEVYFKGPDGRIEGMLAEFADPKAPIALVLHPHPLHGGTMNNKVVYNVYKTLFENDFTVLRVNFRGVGKSTGKFDDGVGEMTDAATALDWLQVRYPMSNVSLVAGFSFGSWIAMQLIMRRPEISNFMAVAPPVNKYDFSFLAPCPIPGLIVQGDQDSVVTEASVNDLAQRLAKQKNIDIEYRMVGGADHFFRNKIDEMNEEIDDYLKGAFSHQESRRKKSKGAKAPIDKGSKKIFLD